MRRIILNIMLLCWSIAVVATSETYTVVISLDGCRWDYPQWYNTPFFDRMANEGTASSLIPCFPSKTFPNHYSLATGLTPEHHGLIANEFMDCETGYDFNLSNRIMKKDPKYFGGEPIWLTAQRQGLRTAIFYWAGSVYCPELS
ncbi:MAG: ectonucleotide pyrophosphatase/phosphodiesterase [Prevotella sp.]|nr:ectonucleotide pyrophosphatase/phosphodiesterase [Prevotella sp.]